MAAKDPVAWVVLQAMEDLLQAVDGTGDWNYDLSGTNVVQLGEVLPKNRDPSLSNGRRLVIGPVTFSTLRSERNLFYDGLRMGVYIYASAGLVNDYPTRIEALLRLGHDVTRALSLVALQAAMSTIETDKGCQIVAVDRFDLDASGLPERDLGGVAFLYSIDYRTRDRGSTGGI